MKTRIISIIFTLIMATRPSVAQEKAIKAEPLKDLKVHAIFASNMVLQRGKPIKVWGWAKPGDTVTVQLGNDKAEAKAGPEVKVEVFGHEQKCKGKGRWEVTFKASEASSDPQTLTISAGDETVKMTNIVIGDVWVMYGQSNMAFPLGKTDGRDLALQANLPLLRLFSITTNEQGTPQDDIRPEAITTAGWEVCNPNSASAFSAIGMVFGMNVQRSLGIPIGLIKNARGGASIESMVPLHKFDDDPIAKRYADYIKAKMAEFDPEVESNAIWARKKARAKAKGQPEPERQDPTKLGSWSVPGKSPSHMASVYNGCFGVFKGISIKGVLFHQGYNNTLSENARPRRYRVLARLMVEGIREDFSDPELPFCIIGFCADGKASQNTENFEVRGAAIAPFIREAQRLGLADVKNQSNLAFIPAYDVHSQGLHPKKKRRHGWRAAKWALSNVYVLKGVQWRKPVELKVAEPHGDVMVLRFNMRVRPNDGSQVPTGFSIAGQDGKFYMAHARFAEYGKEKYWTHGNRTIHVWSPLVEEPIAVRYAWGIAPMGNLYNDGAQDQPYPSFRTDSWNFPETDDPAVAQVNRNLANGRKADAEARLEERKAKEAEVAKEIIQRLETLSEPLSVKE